MKLLSCPACGWTVAIRAGHRVITLRKCHLCGSKQRFMVVE